MVWSLAQARVVISDLKADYIRRRRHLPQLHPGQRPSPPSTTRECRFSRSSGAATACTWPMRSSRAAVTRCWMSWASSRRACPAKPQHPTSPSTIRLPGRGHRPDSVLGRDARGHRPRGSSLGTPGVGVMGARRDGEWAPPWDSDDGVVVAVPDRRQLDLPPHSAGSLRDAHRRGRLGEWKRRAAGDSWAGWRPLASRPWPALPALFTCIVIHREPRKQLPRTATPSSRCVPASAPQKQELLAPTQPAPAERQLGDPGSVAGT
jgi:hypothetical protein